MKTKFYGNPDKITTFKDLINYYNEAETNINYITDNQVLRTALMLELQTETERILIENFTNK